MKAAVDLHIHSALSPCSDDEMTPNNIINMSKLKGLDIIAVTDHNSLENYPALMKCAEEADIVLVPGMEMETREEVHLICLFKDFESAFTLQEKVYAALPQIKNRADIFGNQLIMDEQDEVLSHLERLLRTATSMGVDEVFSLVESLDGVVIPAHVDRESFSLLTTLGCIPEYLPAKYLEISHQCALPQFLDKHPELKQYQFIRSSDAHHLGTILERESFLEVETLSSAGLIDTLKHPKI